MSQLCRPIVCIILTTLALSACGKQKTSSQVYEKAAEECVADVIPKQFVVHYTDGHSEVVHAESEKAFLDGFVAQNLDRIEFAEPDYLVRAFTPTATPRAASADNWGVARIGADQLWAQGIRGSGVAIAVVDSGMDIQHPQLVSRVFVNRAEIPGNNVDDDANGLIDDYYGYDYVAEKGLTRDNQYHGTHVAGIIAAHHTDNAASATLHVQGVAPESKILPLAFLNSQGAGAMSDGVLAIRYAAERGVRVINASWGGSICSRSLRDEIDSLEAKNVLFVAASGNEAMNIDRYKSYPASLQFPAQITVGATGENDLMSDYSNYGSQTVHLFAPGTLIVSTIPGNQMAALSGTSMAAPMFAGAAALLLSAEPTAKNSQLRQAFYNTAFKQNTYMNASHGRLDLRQALAELRRLMGK